MRGIGIGLAVVGTLVAGCTSKAELDAARAEARILRDQLAKVSSERDSCRGRLSLLEAASTRASVTKSPERADSSTAAVAGGTADSHPMVGSKEVLRAYEENEVAADERFKDKHVLIVGHVQQISKTLGHPSASVGPVNWNRRIICRFEDDSPEPATLRRGQLVILNCVGAGTTLMRSPAFDHCQVVDVSSVAERYPTLLARDPKNPTSFALIGSLKDEVRN